VQGPLPDITRVRSDVRTLSRLTAAQLRRRVRRGGRAAVGADRGDRAGRRAISTPESWSAHGRPAGVGAAGSRRKRGPTGSMRPRRAGSGRWLRTAEAGTAGAPVLCQPQALSSARPRNPRRRLDVGCPPVAVRKSKISPSSRRALRAQTQRVRSNGGKASELPCTYRHSHSRMCRLGSG
jgi:hypothetical protein